MLKEGGRTERQQKGEPLEAEEAAKWQDKKQQETHKQQKMLILECEEWQKRNVSGKQINQKLILKLSENRCKSIVQYFGHKLVNFDYHVQRLTCMPCQMLPVTYSGSMNHARVGHIQSSINLCSGSICWDNLINRWPVYAVYEQF